MSGEYLYGLVRFAVAHLSASGMFGTHAVLPYMTFAPVHQFYPFHAHNPCAAVDPSETKLLLTEAPLGSKANREKIVDVMFSKFGFSHIYVGVQAVLTLYAQGQGWVLGMV